MILFCVITIRYRTRPTNSNGSLNLFSYQPAAEILAWVFGPLDVLANIYVIASCVQNLTQKYRNRNKVTGSNTSIYHNNKNSKRFKRTLSRSVTVLLASLSLDDTLSSLYLFILAISNTYYTNLQYTTNTSQVDTNFSFNDQIIKSIMTDKSPHKSSINSAQYLRKL